MPVASTITPMSHLTSPTGYPPRGQEADAAAAPLRQMHTYEPPPPPVQPPVSRQPPDNSPRRFPLQDVQEACLLRYFIEEIAHWVRA